MAEVAGVMWGMSGIAVVEASVGTRLLQILSDVSIPEPFKRMMMAEARSMMELIERLQFKSEKVGLLAESVLHLNKVVKCLREDLRVKEELMAGVKAPGASMCKEFTKTARGIMNWVRSLPSRSCGSGPSKWARLRDWRLGWLV